MMKNHKSSKQLKVNGKMTAKGADRVGLILAASVFMVALSILIVAVKHALN